LKRDKEWIRLEVEKERAVGIGPYWHDCHVGLSHPFHSLIYPTP